MNKLSKTSLEKAEAWIKANARPLEKTLFNFLFRNGSSQEVIGELKAFQNPDGGFGNAIEPDLRTSHSSVLGTSLAFQILRSLEADTDDSLIKPAVRFFLNNYNENVQSWRIIPPEAEKSPHAPWWTQIGREDNFDGFHLNPTAEILGYLYDYKELVSAKLILTLTAKVLEKLSSLKEIEMHDFLCCKRLSESKNLETSIRTNLISELRRLLDTCVVKDSSKWSGYGLRPVQVADSPDSPFINPLRSIVETNLDYEIEAQDNTGVWLPTWSWRGNFPNEWEQTKKEWTGIITLEKITLLKRFGIIEDW